jgi:integrase
VPLIGRAEKIVRRRLATHGKGFLFPSEKGGPVDQKISGVAVWMHMPYSKTRPTLQRPRLTVTHWAPHDLRRTARTLLASLGVRSEVAEACLGHVQPGIVGVYQKYTFDKEKREALLLLDAELERLSANHLKTLAAVRH